MEDMRILQLNLNHCGAQELLMQSVQELRIDADIQYQNLDSPAWEADYWKGSIWACGRLLIQKTMSKSGTGFGGWYSYLQLLCAAKYMT